MPRHFTATQEPALGLDPRDGHTLGPIIADLERLTGVETRRIHVDKGYRGHNHPHRFRVWISGQLRRVTREEIAEPYIRSELITRTKIPHSRRRSSKRTEPIYYGGRRKPSHGFSRSPSVLVMAKLTFALSGYALSTAPSGTSPASR